MTDSCYGRPDSEPAESAPLAADSLSQAASDNVEAAVATPAEGPPKDVVTGSLDPTRPSAVARGAAGEGASDREPKRGEPALPLEQMTLAIRDGVLMVFGPEGDPVPPHAFAATAASRPDMQLRLPDGAAVRASRVAAVLRAQITEQRAVADRGDAWILMMLGQGKVPEPASEEALRAEDSAGTATVGDDPARESDDRPEVPSKWAPNPIVSSDDGAQAPNQHRGVSGLPVAAESGSFAKDDAPAQPATVGGSDAAHGGPAVVTGPPGGAHDLPEADLDLDCRGAAVDSSLDLDFHLGFDLDLEVGSEHETEIDSLSAFDDCFDVQPEDLLDGAADPGVEQLQPGALGSCGDVHLGQSSWMAAEAAPPRQDQPNRSAVLSHEQGGQPDAGPPATGRDLPDPATRREQGMVDRPAHHAASDQDSAAVPGATSAARGTLDGPLPRVKVDAAAPQDDAVGASHGADVDPERIALVVIRGVPEDAVLSTGTRDEDGSWSISPLDLSSVVIRLPDEESEGGPAKVEGELDITGIAFTEGGDLVAVSETVPLADYLDQPAPIPSADFDADGKPAPADSCPVPLQVDPEAWQGDSFDALVVRDLPPGARMSAGAYDPSIGGWVLMPEDLSGLEVEPPRGSGNFSVTLLGVTLGEGDGNAARVLARVRVAPNPDHPAPSGDWRRDARPPVG